MSAYLLDRLDDQCPDQMAFRFEYHFTVDEVCDGAFLRQRGLLAQLPATVAWYDYEQYWRWREE